MYGKACPAATSYQQDSRVRNPPLRLKVNYPVLVKDVRRANESLASVDLVNDGLGRYRLGPEGRLVVVVRQGCP
jgi:hypothetical protein